MKKFLTLIIILVTIPALAYSQGKIGISVQGGLTLPRTNFSDFYDSGYGGTGFLFFGLSPGIEVTATSGYFTWDHMEIEHTLTTIPLLLGVRYYFGEGGYAPYAALEGGLHFKKTDTLGIVDKWEELGYGIGGGLLFRLSGNFFIDLGVKYNSILYDGDFEASRDFLSFMLGLRIAFK
jgi:opacity protein-like surface antigen